MSENPNLIPDADRESFIEAADAIKEMIVGQCLPVLQNRRLRRACLSKPETRDAFIMVFESMFQFIDEAVDFVGAAAEAQRDLAGFAGEESFLDSDAAENTEFFEGKQL